MSNNQTLLPPEVQCSLKPWLLDTRYVYNVERIHRKGEFNSYLYERYPAWAAQVKMGMTDPDRDPHRAIVANHVAYLKDVLDTTAWLIDERVRRREIVRRIRVLLKIMKDNAPLCKELEHVEGGIIK